MARPSVGVFLPPYPLLRDDIGMLAFRPGRSDERPGNDLLGEMIAHLNEVYPDRVRKPGSVTDPEEMVAPRGIFLVGYEDGVPVACGGLRRLDDGVAEIKRMYVASAVRSRGVGRALLEALEDAARALGYERIRLDSGPEQVHGQALFRTAGYMEIAKYNDNHIADYWAEKRLS
jgi:GNAT superfamily N-acetyltransferase